MYYRTWLSLVVKTLPQFLFSVRPYPVTIENRILYIHPRSFAYMILKETFFDKLYKPSNGLTDVKTILDLGGYVGDFTVWAEKEYSPEIIVTLEPKKSLFEILKKNILINNIARVVRPLNKAIYEKSAKLNSTASLRDASSSFSEESETGAVEGISLEDLLKEFKLDKIDYFKMDIEGAEKFVLTPRYKDFFTHKVRYVNYETHEKWGFGKKDAREYLESLGFSVRQIDQRGRYAQFEAYNLNLAQQIKPDLGTLLLREYESKIIA